MSYYKNLVKRHKFYMITALIIFVIVLILDLLGIIQVK